MRQLSVFLWVVFGVVVGYQLRTPETITVPIVKEGPVRIQKEIVYKNVYQEIPGKCDYDNYEKAIAELQGQLDKTTTAYRDVVVPVYIPTKVIVSKPKTSSLTVLFSVGEGIKSVDIQTSPDGSSVHGEPKKGMVGGISAFYKFKPFSIGPLDVNGLTVGGGLMGAETKFGSIGYTWTFP